MLIVTALGMFDSMKAYIDWEFGTITNFDYKLSLSEDYTDNQLGEIISKYGDSSSQTFGVEFKQNDEIIVKQLTVNNSKGLLQEIVGFVRDPQNQQFNCTKEFFDTLDDEYKADTVYTNQDLGGLKEIPGINTIQTVQNLKDGMNSMLSMMYSVIALLIVISIILACVIIYNLGILSFAEKEYQFATLKVLGFKYKSIKSIFIKQNIWISIVAILISLPLGNLMTDYIFVNAIGDTYDFSAMIKPLTFVVSGVGTFVVTYLVNKLLARKIKKIDMVTSLKGNE